MRGHRGHSMAWEVKGKDRSEEIISANNEDRVNSVPSIIE